MIEKIAENFLYHIWDEQHLKENLKTTNADSVKILFQGKWNTKSGPDFHNSILLIGNKKIHGDVEIHCNESDWRHHKHHEDSNFNDVILHVVFQMDSPKKYTISENGSKIPILTLKNNLEPQITKLWEKYSGKKFDTSQTDTISCELTSYLESEEQLLDILKKYGNDRFRRKSKRFSAELYNSDFNQIIYKGILEALGYSKNKIPFLKLASELSYKKLHNFTNTIESSADLFCLLTLRSNIDITKYNYKFITDSLIEKYKNMKFKLGYDLKSEMQKKYNWNFFRLRPTNHPLSRLWQIAPFLYNILNKNLANQVLSVFSVSTNKPIKYSQFKNNFYNLINQSGSKNQRIGKSRCDDIFVNIVLPVGYIYADTLNYSDLKQTILKTYENLGKLSRNYITKYVRSRLSILLKHPRKIKLIHQQGMIQLYYKFCSKHECENCKHFTSKVIN